MSFLNDIGVAESINGRVLSPTKKIVSRKRKKSRVKNKIAKKKRVQNRRKK